MERIRSKMQGNFAYSKTEPICAEKINDLSIDLLATCKGMIASQYFMYLIAPSLADSQLQGAIQRYVQFMILKAKYPKHMLVTTIEIEMIWQAHLLHPTKYIEFCAKTLNSAPIDHPFVEHVQKHVFVNALEQTCSLWNKLYKSSYLAQGWKEMVLPSELDTFRHRSMLCFKDNVPESFRYYEISPNADAKYDLSNVVTAIQLRISQPTEVQHAIKYVFLFILNIIVSH